MTVRRRTEWTLSAERILFVALAIVDAEGLAALNARRLAHDLDVSTMATYSHFDNMESLLDAMVEYTVRPPATEPADAPWRDRLRAAVTDVHDSLVRHPGVIELLMSRSRPEPSLDLWRERVYGILRSAGLDDTRCAQGGAALAALVFGSIILECFRARDDQRGELERMKNLPADSFPNLRHIAPHYIQSHTGSGAFAFALSTLIDSLDT